MQKKTVSDHSKAAPHRHLEHPSKRLLLALLINLALVANGSSAADNKQTSSTAQTSKPSASESPIPSVVLKPDNTPVTKLETVTVTARFGLEKAKDLPFSLHVISGETLETQRLLSLEDALRNTPGVDVNSSGDSNYTNVRIRGVGSLNQVGMDDSSVVLNIDGVSMSARNISLGTLDIERVEILKGPQGTLFGRNSEAGAINVTTRRPTPYTEGYIRTEIGQDKQHLEEAVISGPLSDQLSGRFAIRNSGADHWVENAQNGHPISKPKTLAFRGSLLWNPDPGTSALLIAERQEIKRDASLMIMRPYGSTPKNDLTPGTFNDNKKTMERYSIEVNHDLENSRITSITAATATDYFGVKGYDRTLMKALYGYSAEYTRQDAAKEHTVSQDLRWGSLPDASLFWVTGINLSRANRSFDSRDHVTGNTQDRDYATHSYAAYGETTYPLTHNLKLTGGLRHTWDHKTYNGKYFSKTVVTDKRKLTDDYSTGRLALSYALTPETNLYSVIARGYKSGGFSDYPIQISDSKPYKAAEANSVEMGFKTETADRRLTLSGALFFNKVKDDHMQGFDNATFSTHAINADTKSKGVELEGRWRFDNGFTLSGGLSYIDAKITSNALGVYGGDVASNNRVPDVPRWNTSVAIAYQKNLPEFMGLSAPVFDALLNYHFVGKRPADPQNNFDLGSYQKVDLRIGVLSGNTEIYLWGQNLLDKKYDLYGNTLAPGITIGVPARGRNIGLGFTYHF